MGRSRLNASACAQHSHAYRRRQGPCRSATGACEPPGRATPPLHPVATQTHAPPRETYASASLPPLPWAPPRPPRQLFVGLPAAIALCSGIVRTRSAVFGRAPPSGFSGVAYAPVPTIPAPRTRVGSQAALPAPRHRNRHGPRLVTASLCAPKLPAGLATLLEHRHESGGCLVRLGGRSVVPGIACYADSSRALDAKPAQRCKRVNFRHRPTTTGQQTCANRRSSAPR
jgi:hypothetical protein